MEAISCFISVVSPATDYINIQLKSNVMQEREKIYWTKVSLLLFGIGIIIVVGILYVTIKLLHNQAQ